MAHGLGFIKIDRHRIIRSQMADGIGSTELPLISPHGRHQQKLVKTCQPNTDAALTAMKNMPVIMVSSTAQPQMSARRR